MSAHWLSVIGVGEHGVAGLDATARASIEAAAQVIGPPRAIAPLLAAGRNAVPWQAPLDRMIAQILALRGSRTVVLATGDPSWFGIGATLGRHLPPDEYEIAPSPSAFSLACARLRWPLQEVACVSLHGRAVSGLVRHVQPRARILALTSDASTVSAVADLLVSLGCGRSRLTVLSHMGGPDETRAEFIAAAFNAKGVADFNTLAVECVADPHVSLRPAVPGLPDDAFEHDGQLTKREVRAATLARLAPTPGAMLWDVGAGCGSVSIEWMRAAAGARAVAIERDRGRRELIARNAEALGTPGLDVSGSEAPEGFAGHEPPDAIFLGGDVANEALFGACWDALPPGGRLVANAVTLDGEAALIARHQRLDGELTRIAVSRLDSIGDRRAFRPLMPVAQWAVIKRDSR
ncbi:MAG TPA: precorrin-6y C5,15-methyltransferase (decarboxylating) subunit CbiE [Devosiaceae bacterium]|nr:precorrin-6y C5,15-methyltransferase (decarboxylating) subunit CbiE [Devosiaceae bacterium]